MCWVCLLLPSKCEMALGEDTGKHSMTPLAVIRFAPAVILAIFTFAFFDTAMLALLPLYGLQYGLSEQTAVLAVSVLFIGDALFQMPLGWLANVLVPSGTFVLRTLFHRVFAGVAMGDEQHGFVAGVVVARRQCRRLVHLGFDTRGRQIWRAKIWSPPMRPSASCGAWAV